MSAMLTNNMDIHTRVERLTRSATLLSLTSLMAPMSHMATAHSHRHLAAQWPIFQAMLRQLLAAMLSRHASAFWAGSVLRP